MKIIATLKITRPATVYRREVTADEPAGDWGNEAFWQLLTDQFRATVGNELDRFPDINAAELEQLAFGG